MVPSETILPILHTDDTLPYHEVMRETFARYGIPVDSFATNDDVVTAIKPGGSRFGAEYSAAIIDFHTKSNVEGAQLISILALNGICKDVLLLSSTGTKSDLEQQIEAEKVRISQPLTSIQRERFKKIQYFEKETEIKLLEIYVAARILFPQETEDFTREDLLQMMSIKTEHGFVPVSKRPLFDEQLKLLYQDVGRSPEKLKTLVQRVSLYKESLRNGNPEREN